MSLLDASLWEGKIYLNGWRPGGCGTADAVEPATGATLGRYGLASVEDVREAVTAAAAAHGSSLFATCGRAVAGPLRRWTRSARGTR
ncbi:hypothetical protein [Arthrobacter sp. AL12]|uniref:hypothetical protein n=1 Tax=Arthrobacter sp. AL12 TaxID=3042241 RepID=UPI00249B9CD1|nr:hypothetical protein [Arthrobacter sp. AL12]MDI3212472.1 hypothetical protein [Arthrobacter sp. AL12]